MNNKALEGIKKASPEKRYKHFLSTVSDSEVIWLLSSSEGLTTYDFDGYVNVPVWSRKEFCSDFETEADKPFSMEIHEFLDECRSLEDCFRFMVFPTKENSYMVDKEQLCEDIEDFLDEIE